MTFAPGQTSQTLRLGILNDTVADEEEAPAGATGLKFRDYTPDALVWAVDRALAAFPNSRRWKAMQVNGMRRDFSWDVSAREYVKVYRGA